MSFISKNPYTRKILKEVPFWSLEKTKGVVDLLNKEYLKNKQLDPAARKHKVKKEIEHLSKSLTKHKRRLAETLTAEMGKPVKFSEGEIQKSINHCSFYLAHIDEFLNPKFIKTDVSAKTGYFLDPLGVIYKIVPFNFPIWISFKMVVPTMLTGNTVLIRPAASTPQVGEVMQEILDDAQLQSVKVGFASHDDTEAILKMNAVQGVSFTGSTASGSRIAEAAARNLKRCVLELGGNDPFIVLDDADIKLAVEVACRSRLLNSGQVCFSSKRFIVDETVMEQFISQLQAKIETYKLGDPMQDGTTLGPLSREDLTQKYLDQLARSVKSGDEVRYGNEAADGNLVKPSIFVVKNYEKSPLTNEEVFGPMFSIIPYKQVDQAIELANKTTYGLGSTIISKDVEYAEGLARLIDAGFCFINDPVTSHSQLPAGGVKASGFGRDCGSHGVESFANVKAFSIKSG